MADIVLKASQLSELTDLTGNEIIFLSINDRAYRVKTSVLINLFATITKAQLGLDRVDNTSDIDKPISNRTRMALDNKANLNHQHTVSDIADIDTVLDLKADISHRHNVTDIDGLVDLINGISLGDHTHEIIDVEGLSDVLLNKADLVHIHSMNDVLDLVNTLSQKANLLHTHQIVEVEGLNDVLVGKADVNHTHPISSVTNLQTEIDRLDDRIDSAGTGGVGLPISISDVIGLQGSLDNRSLVGHTHPLTDLPETQSELTRIEELINTCCNGNVGATGVTLLEVYTTVGMYTTGSGLSENAIFYVNDDEGNGWAVYFFFSAYSQYIKVATETQYTFTQEW